MKNSEINYAITQKNWDLLMAKYSPDTVIVEIKDFHQAILILNEICKKLMDFDCQVFAVDFLYQIKEKFKDDWEKDWKNEVFLGKLCTFAGRYDEEYAAYKRAYDRLDDPPDSLLLLLSRCCIAPGTPPISKEEAEEYLMRAIKKNITYEAAIMMGAFYWRKNDKAQENYWDKLSEKLEREGKFVDPLTPDELKKFES